MHENDSFRRGKLTYFIRFYSTALQVYLANYDMHLQLGEPPSETHSLAKSERQRREWMVLAVGALDPTLGTELRRFGEVLLTVPHHVVLKDHLSLK